MFLQQFKLNTEKFSELFSRHRKSPNRTWKDYYFERQAYFEGWVNELKINSFDGLKNLMIADKMKEMLSKFKEHFPDVWEDLIFAEMLANTLEAFDNIRRFLPVDVGDVRRQVKPFIMENRYDPRNLNAFLKWNFHPVPNERSSLRYYGCGRQA
ncbi:uncharacterized protein TNCV_5048301 [Trichonephila clavipes]|nr:uncharacterized protein TNCV_5048301 [Trichonephila clavipes]